MKLTGRAKHVALRLEKKGSTDRKRMTQTASHTPQGNMVMWFPRCLLRCPNCLSNTHMHTSGHGGPSDLAFTLAFLLLFVFLSLITTLYWSMEIKAVAAFVWPTEPASHLLHPFPSDNTLCREWNVIQTHLLFIIFSTVYNIIICCSRDMLHFPLKNRWSNATSSGH